MITLTTDFGYRDPFVGVMKGVILGIAPEARIIDITHGISPHDVMEAALTIGESYGYFPGGSIHVVVVDPGVGSGRKPIVVEAGESLFIGPDNGVFSEVYRLNKERAVYHITASHYFLRSPGSTFHGRDVFAPVAAWLSRGTKVENIGKPIEDYASLDIPAPYLKDDILHGEAIHIDRFGNVITNIMASDIKDGPFAVNIKDGTLDIRDYYEEAGDGRPHALINSSGRLEIFVYKGNAAEILNIKRGEAVELKKQ